MSSISRMSDDERSRLVQLLDGARFELLPLPGAIRHSEFLTDGASVAVTADPEQGMGPTVGLSIELAARGFEVVPHIAAQLITDRGELAGVVERLHDAGITRALVVGGVASDPGPYRDALSLMDALDELNSPLAVGVGGYPEGHHMIDDEVIESALSDKASRAQWVTTQICLDTKRLESWIAKLRVEGIELPIWVGLPAVADLTGLFSLGLKVGAGRSLQFAFEHPRLVTRLLKPGGRAANEHAIEVASLEPSSELAGLHVFTYNQVAAARRWRRRLRRRLEH